MQIVRTEVMRNGVGAQVLEPDLGRVLEADGDARRPGGVGDVNGVCTVPLLQAIRPRNLLSFGPNAPSIPLLGLNVLIGPNGSGKSNLLECIALLRSACTDMRDTVLMAGGVREWIWKGRLNATAVIDAVVTGSRRVQPLRHVLEFRASNQRLELEDEWIEDAVSTVREPAPSFYYRSQQGRPIVALAGGGTRELARESLDPELSILAQRGEPDVYPEITYLAEVYSQIRLYREWEFGPGSSLRQPQATDGRSDRLAENFSNLGLVLNRLKRSTKVRASLLSRLRDLYDGLTDVDVSVEGGTVQISITEGRYTIPVARLPDGTLRYLCLLAILCDPSPPPLIGIEEPELGLHPDLIPKVADLLMEASKSTQLIVTTHSDILVDSLSERPESVLVCEKHDAHTEVTRLDEAELGEWLDKYRLGELWTRGNIGANAGEPKNV
jgi:predicted ATPase